MPHANGLFHKANVESAPGLFGATKAPATETARTIMAELGIEPNNVAALFDLAVVERDHLSKTAEAKKHFEQFLEVAPDGAAKDYAERAVQEGSSEGGS